MKDIHIVFQVINFLHSEKSKELSEELTSSDKLVLINLASHKGKKGIFPSISRISNELNLGKRQIIRCLLKLQELSLIKIKKTAGLIHQYELSNFNTTGDTHVTGDIDDTGDTHVTGVVTSMTLTGDIHDIAYKEVITKEVTKEITERGKTSHKNFFPNLKNQEVCKKLGLDLDEQMESFMSRCVRPKTQYEFTRWLQYGYDYNQKKQQKKPSSPKKFYSMDDPTHPKYEELQRIKKHNEDHNKVKYTEINSVNTDPVIQSWVEKVKSNVMINKNGALANGQATTFKRNTASGGNMHPIKKNIFSQ